MKIRGPVKQLLPLLSLLATLLLCYLFWSGFAQLANEIKQLLNEIKISSETAIISPENTTHRYSKLEREDHNSTNSGKNRTQCPPDFIIEEAAKQRKHGMLKACKECIKLINAYDNYNYRGPGRRAYPSAKRKVVYFAIHKNGHTSAAEYVNAKWEKDGNLKPNMKVLFSKGYDIPWKTDSLWLPWKDYLRFTFVNNPLVRLVSGFLEKLYRPAVPNGQNFNQIFNITRPKIIGKVIGRTAKYWSKNKPRMEELFQYLNHENNPKRIDPHYQPQYLFWPFCDPHMFDFIGTVGNMTCEIEYVARKASGLKQVAEFFDNPRNDLTERAKFLRSVPPELVRKVLLKHYLPDYKIFGYDLPDFDNWNSTISHLFGIL